MGGNAVEVLKSFNLDEQKYDVVKENFEQHFVGRTNVTFERARFNRRTQGEGESVIDFIEDLNKLAETCEFGPLKEDLIRDRIVVGIRNAQLSQRLMQNDKLTLEKATNQVKAAELTKQQHEMLKEDGKEMKIAAVRGKKKSPRQIEYSTPEYRNEFQEFAINFI